MDGRVKPSPFSFILLPPYLIMKFNKLVPELTVSNLKKSLEFYVNLLGFKVEYEREENKFAFLSFQGSQIMLEEVKKVKDPWQLSSLEFPFGRGVNFQFEVKDLKPLLKALKENNHKLHVGPQESWYRKGKALLGQKEFLVLDPDGYLLRFARGLGEKKA
jgi:catechol 2,3-dioxygenase-like lactoylglutathione lyase family enzyme